MNNKEKYNTGSVQGDSEIARAAEELAIKVLSKALKDTTFESLHDDEGKFHYGDVLAKKGNKEKYIDIKDDGRISETGNVFCESHKYFYDNPNKKHDGFMNNSLYDYLAVLDQVRGKLYLLDFKKLKNIYKNYRLVKSDLSDCTSFGNLVPLYVCRNKGILKFEITFTDLKSFICINQVV